MFSFNRITNVGSRIFPRFSNKGLLRCFVDIEKEEKAGNPKKVLEGCKKLIHETNSILHPLNVYLVRVLDHAFDAAVDDEQWEKAQKYGLKNLQAYRTYYPKYSPNLAVQLFKVGKLQLYLQDLDGALELLEQAQSVIEATHGVDHPVYKDVTLFVNQCREEMRANFEGL